MGKYLSYGEQMNWKASEMILYVVSEILVRLEYTNFPVGMVSRTTLQVVVPPKALRMTPQQEKHGMSQKVDMIQINRMIIRDPSYWK